MHIEPTCLIGGGGQRGVRPSSGGGGGGLEDGIPFTTATSGTRDLGSVRSLLSYIFKAKNTFSKIFECFSETD